MPNGGSDNCGTCGFNAKNRHADRSEGDYCEIRDVLIENPFWTYCANHPHRRPQRDPIPIGPITRHSGGGSSNDREVWLASPDTEEIRQHLLGLLENFFKHVSESRYPIGPDIGQVVLLQLGEFREKRAEGRIRWISENLPSPWADIASAALKSIEKED